MRTLLFLAALTFAPLAQAQSLESLHWLKGCWRTIGDGPVITEVWSAPPMPAMVGYAYTTRDGEVRNWEQTRIQLIDGVPHFIAMPGDGAPVRFRLSATVILINNGPPADGYVAFENTEHDYPQVVSYARFDNRLRAQISLADLSNPMTFHYRRISCSSALRP